MGSAWSAGLFQLRSHLLSKANDSVGLSIDRLRSLTGFRGTRSNGLYGRAPSVRGPFFRPQGYERVGVSLVEEYKRVGKSVISVCKKAQKGSVTDAFYCGEKSRKRPDFVFWLCYGS